ncbi:MAG: DJ-1/PfpI family protein, partial [Marmoricola sp.]|nr:DJ-1/PfpI family protein [Marmoricola sp.]
MSTPTNPIRTSRARRVLLIALTCMLTLVTLAGFVLAGALTASRATYPADSSPKPGYTASTQHAEPGTVTPTSPALQGRRIVVAFVAGVTGTIPSDLLAPYDIFASSPAFSTYVVAESSRPAPLEGGPSLMPTYTFTDIDAHPALRPDLVVVPGLTMPDSPQETPLRTWVSAQHHAGSRVLGVCSGAMVLAATGMLDGLHATSHWSRIGALEAAHPKVHWVRGQRYVEDGTITTTAAVSSGVPAALHLVAQLAGSGEAQRIADEHPELAWTPTLGTTIRSDHFELGDWPVGLNWAMPWFRPTLGIYLRDGVDELDTTAAFEVYSQSAAARTVALANGGSVRTRHGLQLLTTSLTRAPHLARVVIPDADTEPLVPRVRRWAHDRALTPQQWTGRSHDGAKVGSGFATALEDLAAHTDGATASTTAKMIGYPTTDLELGPQHRSFRGLLLALLALIVAVLIGTAPARL